MRKFITSVLLLTSSLVFSQINNQNLTSSEIRSANISSINIVNEYSSVLNNKTSYYSDLYTLFSDSSSKVVFDILPENKLDETVELQKYILKAARNHREQKVVIDIKEIEISEINQDVKIIVTIDKLINATTRNGVKYKDLLSDLKMYLSLEKSNEFESRSNYEVKIDSINSEFPINCRYNIVYVVEKKSTYDLVNNNLLVDGHKPISYQTDWIGDEGNNYFFFKNTTNTRFIRYELDQAPFSFGLSPVNKRNYDNYRSFKNVKNALLLKIKRPRYSFSLFSNTSGLNFIESDLYGYRNNKTDNSLTELGFHFGYYLNYKPKPIYHYISLSLGMSNMNLLSNISVVDLEYQYDDVDPLGNKYLRKIKINRLYEKHDISYLNIPLSIKYGFNMNEFYKNKSIEKYSLILPDFISVSLSGIYHKLQKSTFNSKAIINYSGYYKDFYGLEINDNDVYDFGDFELENQGSTEFNDYHSGMIVLGLHNKLSKNKDKLFLDVEFGLNFNITEPFDPTKQLISKDFNDLNNSLNTIKSLSMSRNFIRFGITYNFN